LNTVPFRFEINDDEPDIITAIWFVLRRHFLIVRKLLSSFCTSMQGTQKAFVQSRDEAISLVMGISSLRPQ